MARIGVLLLALLIAGFAVGATRPRVRLQVQPRVLFAGRPIRLTITLVPDEAMRLLRVDAEPDDLGASEWSLEGAQSRTRYERVWRVAGAGTYQIRASVFDGRRNLLAYAAQTIVVAEE